MVKRLNTLAARFRDPRVAVRVGLGVLLLANVVMAAVVFKPWASSAEDLALQAVDLQKQVRLRQGSLEKTRALVSKIETARTQGDQFMGTYFINERTTASTMLAELLATAQKAGIRSREASYASEPVEGSDTISMMTITANYEGTFADLMQFLNLLDRSPRFMTVESLQAAPQQAGLALNVSMKLDVFVREGPDIPGATPAPPPVVSDVKEPRPAAPSKPAAPAAIPPPATVAAPVTTPATPPAGGMALPRTRRVRPRAPLFQKERQEEQ